MPIVMPKGSQYWSLFQSTKSTWTNTYFHSSALTGASGQYYFLSKLPSCKGNKYHGQVSHSTHMPHSPDYKISMLQFDCNTSFYKRSPWVYTVSSFNECFTLLTCSIRLLYLFLLKNSMGVHCT